MPTKRPSTNKTEKTITQPVNKQRLSDSNDEKITKATTPSRARTKTTQPIVEQPTAEQPTAKPAPTPRNRSTAKPASPIAKTIAAKTAKATGVKPLPSTRNERRRMSRAKGNGATDTTRSSNGGYIEHALLFTKVGDSQNRSDVYAAASDMMNIALRSCSRQFEDHFAGVAFEMGLSRGQLNFMQLNGCWGVYYSVSGSQYRHISSLDAATGVIVGRALQEFWEIGRAAHSAAISEIDTTFRRVQEFTFLHSAPQKTETELTPTAAAG